MAHISDIKVERTPRYRRQVPRVVKDLPLYGDYKLYRSNVTFDREATLQQLRTLAGSEDLENRVEV